jgi:superfamily I DNA/RNA helicase
MIDSPYQTAIYDWIKHGDGHGLVDAVAGSGKTTTAVKGSTFIPNRWLRRRFLAFNRSIVQELQSRLGDDVECRTLNGLGHMTLGRRFQSLGRKLILDERKYLELSVEAVDFYGLTTKDGPAEIVAKVRELVSFCQSSLSGVEPDSIADVADHYGVEIPEGVDEDAVYAVVATVMRQGVLAAKNEGRISFDDQIWLPAVWGLTPPKVDFTIIDEVQDLSRAKFDLAYNSCDQGGRMLCLGDERQAIYGFAGADARSFSNIAKKTNATRLPLSISYRCPQLVVAKAKLIVPHIEASPDAKLGCVDDIDHDLFMRMVDAGDVVLCRLTAPLVDLCLRFIRQGRRAHVAGRDIGKSLVKLARDIGSETSWANFGNAVEAYFAYQESVLLAKKNGAAKVEKLRDRILAIEACIEGVPARSLDEFCRGIEELFGEPHGPAITLMTAHRSKGLQWPTVFIVEPKKMPLKWEGQLPWEAEQELNIKYVAITRAMDSLYFVQEEVR